MGRAIGDRLRLGVVGPAPSTAKALTPLATEAVDGARTRHERIDRVADALAAAAIPFVFATGYWGTTALLPAHRDRPALTKP